MILVIKILCKKLFYEKWDFKDFIDHVIHVFVVTRE
jgi:hypothetical protein